VLLGQSRRQPCVIACTLIDAKPASVGGSTVNAVG